MRAINRGGVEDTRLKAEAKATKKIPRPRTAVPWTDPLEAKNRNARGQGQEHSRKCSPKKSSSNTFSGILQFIGVARIFDWGEAQTTNHMQ